VTIRRSSSTAVEMVAAIARMERSQKMQRDRLVRIPITQPFTPHNINRNEYCKK
jgi:hypothetical protein